MALRLNEKLFIPDMLLYLVTGSLMSVVEQVMTIIPSFIIMAKTVPPGVEASMISLTMTIINLSLFVTGGPIGTLINDVFVGVTRENLNDYYVLMIILIIVKFYPLFLIGCLIPTNEAVDEVQQKYL